MGKLLRCIPVAMAAYILAAGIGWHLGQRYRFPLPLPEVLSDVTTASDPVPVPHLSLSSIFTADHSWADALPKDKTVTMIATGDVLPARSVNYKMVTDKGFRWPFEKTADVLAEADITVMNLETPLLSDCIPTVEGMIFCGDARAVEGLTYAGVDVATLGNNHTGNYYQEGVEETKRVLMHAGILPVAVGAAYKEVKGMRFAFLSYNDIGSPEPGVPWANDDQVRTEIAKVKQAADIVVVSPHWGVEYVTAPSVRQRQLARLMIDAGADVILGNHPHWIQPIEIYKEKFIIYAHGNFVFDQEWSEETKLGVIGRYTFYEGNLVDVEYLPIRIAGYGQPYFLDGEEAVRVLRRMEDASKALK